MSQTSVALSDGHRRAPSPEYWLSRTPFPIHPVPGLITCTGVPHLLLYLSSLHTHTHCKVLFCPGWHSEHYSCILWSPRVWLWTVYFCWFSAACPCDIAPWNSDCVAACPDSCPVLFTSLPCLWYSWHCCLITACLTLSKFIKLRLQMDTRLRPFFTEDLANGGSSSRLPTHFRSFRSSCHVNVTPTAASTTHVCYRGVGEDAASTSTDCSISGNTSTRATGHQLEYKPPTILSWEIRRITWQM